jgi:hypothetical protein
LNKKIIYIRIAFLILFLWYLKSNPYVITLFSTTIVLNGQIVDIVEKNYTEGDAVMYSLKYTYNKKDSILVEDIILSSFYNFKKGDYLEIIYLKQYPQKSYLFIWSNILTKVFFSIILPMVFLYVFWIKVEILKKYFN